MTKNSRDKEIFHKINEAVKLLCGVYDLLNEKEQANEVGELDFFSIKDFCKMHPSFSLGSIRHYIFTNKNNFNESVTKKVGSKIFIKRSAFFDWIENA